LKSTLSAELWNSQILIDPMEEGKLAAADGNNRYRGGRHYFTWPVPNALAQLQRGLLTHECLQPNATRTLVRQV
jgi:hypothetical protein